LIITSIKLPIHIAPTISAIIAFGGMPKVSSGMKAVRASGFSRLRRISVKLNAPMVIAQYAKHRNHRAPSG